MIPRDFTDAHLEETLGTEGQPLAAGGHVAVQGPLGFRAGHGLEREPRLTDAHHRFVQRRILVRELAHLLHDDLLHAQTFIGRDHRQVRAQLK